MEFLNKLRDLFGNLFKSNKGENVAEGMRRVLDKYGIQADVKIQNGCVYATAWDHGCKGTELVISWVKRELTLEFKLGTSAAYYEIMSGFVRKYNDIPSGFSIAVLCPDERVGDPDVNKAWVEGFVPAAIVSDKVEEAELFLDIILEDVFVTHAVPLGELYEEIRRLSHY